MSLRNSLSRVSSYRCTIRGETFAKWWSIPLGLLDWDDSQTDLAHLGGVAPGAAKSEGDKLWEDNWDDDDIEEEFSAQLRYAVAHRHSTSSFFPHRNELQKSGKGAVPMQH